MQITEKCHLRVALFEPDIPQNTASIMRLSACFGIGLDIIGPCGFIFSDRKFKRVCMDYSTKVDYLMHVSWNSFMRARENTKGSLVLMTTKSNRPYTAFNFGPYDTILLGRESAGVPESVHTIADARLSIPMVSGVRSLNIVQAASLVAGEALRNIGIFPTR